MTEQFIEAIKQTSTYTRKEGTATSFYLTSGTSPLPERLSISRDKMTATANKGRNLQNKVIGQIMSTFKKSESSPLKQNAPFVLRTNIWLIPSFPTFIGYGTIGISNNIGKIDRLSDTGDLIVLEALEPGWKQIKIHYFAGSVKELEMIMEHLYKCSN